ncbi:MAG: phosphonate ABC transporter ATP-binding protein [Candidatus Binatia bacterium]
MSAVAVAVREDPAVRDALCAASEPPIIDLAVSGLQKSFAGGTSVLRDVHFRIPRGQAVALIGANGSGKSTLLRCCVRLIEPNGGSLRLFGEEIVGLDFRRLRRLRTQVGFIFQQHNLVPRLSALSNVLHGALSRTTGPRVWCHTLASRQERERAWHCLELVGLTQVSMHRADHLSGGQSQRVAIARTLMQAPRMVIADEPVASLDPRAGEEVMRLFIDLMRQEGITLFFTSHHLEHALQYADRVLGLYRGQLAFDAPAPSLDVPSLRMIYEPATPGGGASD